MGLRGPAAKGNNTELRTTISADLDTSLNQLVELSGVSKAAIIRNALNAFLVGLEVVYPGLDVSLDATKTTKTPARTRVRSASFTN